MDTPTSGRFVWRELITPALEESRTFYSQLFDWAPNAVDMGGPAPYTLFNAGAEQAAGMMAPMMEGAPPAWLDYITVDDVEASRATKSTSTGTSIGIRRRVRWRRSMLTSRPAPTGSRG